MDVPYFTLVFRLIAIKSPRRFIWDVPDLFHHQPLPHRSYRSQAQSRLFSTHTCRMTWTLRPYGVFGRDSRLFL